MAITLKEANEKLEAKLSPEELKLVHNLEYYIDEKISKEYKGEWIKIKKEYVQFYYGPYSIQGEYYPLANKRREKMQNELIKRYTDAGWNTGFDSFSFILKNT